MVPDALEAIASRGRAAVAAGDHAVERPPAETGRWGISAVLLPCGEVAAELDRLTSELTFVAGPRHWLSGAADRAHFTVRALEHHDDAISPPAALSRYADALARASSSLGPITLDVRGLRTSPGSVMAIATCAAGTADELRRRFGAELGEDGWLEAKHFPSGRDPIWYASLLHFASEIEDPVGLLRWLDARADLHIGTLVCNAVTVCRWELDERGMRPVRLADVRLA